MNDDQLMEFPEENLFAVMDRMKLSSELMNSCDTNLLCEKYKKLFPAVDGLYLISYSHIEKLNQSLLDDALLSLVKKDFVEMAWDDEKKDFVFKLNKNHEQQ